MNVKEMLFVEMGKIYNDYEISSTELMILYFIRHRTEKIKTGELSAAIYVPMSTLTGILDKMEKKGIIIRKRSSEDRRSVYIGINPDFEAHSGEFLDGTAAMMKNIKKEMTDEKFDQFFASLSLLEKILKKRVEKKDE
ncbi:MAG: MarR family transcriptional regulator [Clostridiales bacterium]|nr:MarR family transcriptional regulator [Clostridiales bacterium]